MCLLVAGKAQGNHIVIRTLPTLTAISDFMCLQRFSSTNLTIRVNHEVLKLGFPILLSFNLPFCLPNSCYPIIFAPTNPLPLYTKCRTLPRQIITGTAYRHWLLISGALTNSLLAGFEPAWLLSLRTFLPTTEYEDDWLLLTIEIRFTQRFRQNATA